MDRPSKGNLARQVNRIVDLLTDIRDELRKFNAKNSSTNLEKLDTPKFNNQSKAFRKGPQ